MPILPCEPTVYPEELFSAADLPIDDAESRWWVLHTRPRSEKVLARLLLNSRKPFFLPLYKRTWRLRGRQLTSFLPLFPGYVFLWGDCATRIAAFQTRLVANSISVEDQQTLHQDLIRVHQMMVSDAPLAPEERLRPGMNVEITQGPLAGLEGKVIRRGKRLRFLVEVHFLQRGASVEIEGWMLKQVDSPALVCSSR